MSDPRDQHAAFSAAAIAPAVAAPPRQSPAGLPLRPMERPVARGKFLFAGEEKLYLRGVTYGTFRPNQAGEEYDREKVDADFARMAAAGINSVRVYTVPPRWLLDAALQHGLRVMVGLPWEQHVAFLDDRKRMRSIEQRVREGARACAGHPAVLCFAIGNEIPSSIVRWHGAPKVERFLQRLVRAVRAEDPGALVTYVNFPSTEYLRLEFVDFLSFNVYLESPDTLERYLARLQNLAGERPLVMAEIGLDSQRNGELGQAETLDWQVRAVFGAGAAGAFVFAWTDEWHRGGHDIEDWDFGLVTRDRQPKAALRAVSAAFAEVPFSDALAWPSVSVIVCSHNGARTLRDTLEGLSQLDYPDYEVIVIDDGSTDATSAIAGEYDVRLIRTDNAGLGAARNTGMRAARGTILAYTDDDARPDPDWLRHIAATYLHGDWVAVGGPNIAPPGDGPIADAVANAPGGPVHVLVTDIEADHIPGCNFTVRKDALEAIGGWDPRFRSAGDDVDCCWRLHDAGGRIGFSHAAVVWHHRRNSVRTYWKQQQGYGRAEALLEQKWPERYNAAGHLPWHGRLYGRGLARTVRGRLGRIYQGTWGTALFQSVYEPAPGLLASLPLMPEWWLVVAGLAALSLLGIAWTPLLAAVPLLVIALLAPIVQAVISARRAAFTRGPAGAGHLRLLTAALYLMQPIARLRGRIRHGLTPWRHRGETAWRLPLPSRAEAWSEEWRAPEVWLGMVEDRLRERGSVVSRGGDFDRWDLAVRGGLLGGARLLLAIEEHGSAKQLARFRVTPSVPGLAWALVVVTLLLAGLAGLGDAWAALAVLASASVALVALLIRDAGMATAAAVQAVREGA